MLSPATSYPGTRPPAGQGGFTMIEVLVALLVLSIGMLGLAALQITALKFNQGAYQRTQAVYQVYDMIDRIRANSVGKTGGLYEDIALGMLPATPPDCAATSCTPAEMADYDIYQWNTSNALLLTGGGGAVCRGSFDAAGACVPAGNVYHVLVVWTEGAERMQVDVEVEL